MERAQVALAVIAPSATFLVVHSLRAPLRNFFLYRVRASEGSQLAVRGKYCTIPLIAKAEAFKQLIEQLIESQ